MISRSPPHRLVLFLSPCSVFIALFSYHRLVLFLSPCSLFITLFCAQVTQKAANQDNEIRTLTKGDYFGEQVDNDDDE